jgi:PAB-dependent poly(A)-specific ribonuclease subunit 2
MTSDLEGKKQKYEKFNYSKYNSTKFVGLENNLPDSFINPFLQVLYNIKPLRTSLLNHLCGEKYCLSCELGFLFCKIFKN